MFWTRFFSGLVLILIAVLGFTLGAPLLTLILAVISLIGFGELAKAFEIVNPEPGRKYSAPKLIGYFGILAYYGVLLAYNCNLVKGDKTLWLLGIIVFHFMAQMFVYVLTFPKYKPEQVGFAIFSFLYAPVMLSFIDMTRALEGGVYLVWIILISSWGCDTFAYVVGKLIGRKKIFPVLSPNKSLEGCIGGILGTAILGAVYGYFCMGFSTKKVWAFAVVCGLGAIFGMVGDLAASAIKRNKGFKDYGKLIPGHGGIMDRFDSVIVTAPMVYFMVVLLIQG